MVPLPSKSSARLVAAPTREKNTVNGARPLCGVTRSVGADVGATTTAMLEVAVGPPEVVANASTEDVFPAIGTKAAKSVPCTAAGAPFTVTPTSAPPACTVPWTSSIPAGTVAPLVGDVIVICNPDVTVKLRDTTALSLPAWSRAFSANVCAPGVSPVSVADVIAENPPNAAPSSCQAKSRLPAGVRLSVPVNVNVALIAADVPLGPPVIW